MSYLPQLGETRKAREMVSVFRGYNHTTMPGTDEFFDMRNMTGDRYPAIAPRAPRRLGPKLAKPNGLFAHEDLCWVDGTDFCYGGEVRGQVEDSRKQFVAMGAYVLIWPDKAYYNTATEEFGSLEARRVTSGAVTFTLCRADGSAYGDYTSGDRAPAEPADGDLWVNTGVVPHVLQQYSKLRGMWVSMPTTYVKISAPGLGADFAAYDGVTVAGCENETLNGDVVLFGAGEDAVIVVGIIDAVFTQETPVTISRTAPDMDFLTECGNRVWGCSSANHEVYSCKLGDPKNWRCFMGISTDSYALTIGTPGDFTGACTHLGYVLFFKEDVIHKLYGDKPANYQMMDINARGVQRGAERSLVVVNETLYYKARSGICAYSAALPQDISAALGPGAYGDAVGGALGDKYYVSMRDGAGAWSLFVFDEAKGMWHREDETRALDIARVGGTLYCLRADGQLLALGGGTADMPAEAQVAWMAETGDIGIQSPDSKYVTNIQLRLEVDIGSLARVLVRYDYADGWKEVYRLNPERKRSYTVPVIPHRCDTMRIRIEGYGPVLAHSICKTMENGSDR